MVYYCFLLLSVIIIILNVYYFYMLSITDDAEVNLSQMHLFGFKSHVVLSLCLRRLDARREFTLDKLIGLSAYLK